MTEKGMSLRVRRRTAEMQAGDDRKRKRRRGETQQCARNSTASEHQFALVAAAGAAGAADGHGSTGAVFVAHQGFESAHPRVGFISR